MSNKFSLADMIRAADVSDSDTDREQIEYIDIGLIDDDPRNFYSLSFIDDLAANIELIGLQQPIRVRPNPDAANRYIVVSGHRRVAALTKLSGDSTDHERFTSVPCIVERGKVSDALRELKLIYANSDTRRMTSAEISRQAERVEMLFYQLKEEGMEFPGRMRDHVAEACKVSKSKLARLKVIRENLIPDLKSVWEEGEMPESVAYLCAQRSTETQKELIKYSMLCKYNQLPSKWSEFTVASCLKTLDREARIQCDVYANRAPCLNHAARMKRLAMDLSRDLDSNCKNGVCCSGCVNLAICKDACSVLTEEIAAAKKYRKDKRAAEQFEQECRTKPTVDRLKFLWARFGDARNAAGVSVQDALAALKYIPPIPPEDCPKYENGKSKISANTYLPYSWIVNLSGLDNLCRLVDLLGCSLDYLFGRTDMPEMNRGQATAGRDLACTSWMPGGTPPSEPGECVAVFDMGQSDCWTALCWFDGQRYTLGKYGQPIDETCLRWIRLPPVPEVKAT